MKFRLLSYNIHKGIGGIDRRYRIERIVETISHLDPDIALLQEVDRGVPRSHKHDQVELLGDLLGYPYRAYQLNVQLTTGGYGNAILSRYPLEQIQHLELKIPFKKRRRALVAVLRLQSAQKSHPILIFNVHLGLAAFERRIQLRRLLNCHLFDNPSECPAVIIGGDFNDVWGNLGRQILEPEQFRSAVGNLKTFPALLPLRSLDRVFFYGHLRLDHSFASQTKVARQASDHLPLVVDFVSD